MTETENVESVIDMLSKDFVCIVEDIENNVRIKGTHPTGKTLFIDALIRPKNPEGWRNGCRTIFGIEFKKDYRKDKEIVKHIAQAIDYSQADWYYKGKKLGKIPILLYPSPIDTNIRFETQQNFIIRLLGLFNIGTIVTQYRKDYNTGIRHKVLMIHMSGSLFYNSLYGVGGNAKNRKFNLKVGSR